MGGKYNGKTDGRPAAHGQHEDKWQHNCGDSNDDQDQHSKGCLAFGQHATPFWIEFPLAVAGEA
jgi:hypothetical protein